MEHYKFDIIVIGAGIVGLSIAHELSNYYDNILLVEKEDTFGRHVSSRNSEVIHSGIYYPTDSLKAKLCVEGNKLLYDFVEKYDIDYKKCGKLILAQDDSELIKLNDLMENGIKNDVEGLKILDCGEVNKIEPLVNCYKALYVPSTGIVDSHGVMKRLEQLTKLNESTICYNMEVEDINKIDDKYEIKFKNEDYFVTSDIVVNCAGLWSDKISSMVGIDDYKIRYCKGEYYKLHKYRNEINTLIYPLPTKISLGIHTVIHLDGTISFGPDAYYVDDINYNMDNSKKEYFYDKVSKYLDISIEDMNEDFSGIRPKIQKDGEEMKDFIIEGGIDKGFHNFINLIGIESPGLTSSLSIAKYVKNILLGDSLR